ncbi:50S ribosomal protein L32 [bacterium]|nr:50S ribosomal protein L32 [bacterium]MBT3729951.1 50S ribosomal protein L32 [bacterium]MBT4894841.1 50S ribosomal protein L32 [bacterium]
MTVRMRHTRSHTANRRSHHALKEPRLSSCPDCKSPTKRHTMCASCGRYRGRVVVDMAAKIEKKQEKAKAKAKARGEEATPEPEQIEDKVLNAAELSKK